MSSDAIMTHSHDPIQITVKTLDGKEILLKVLQTESVLNVKRMIAEFHSIPVCGQRLLFHGKELRNDTTLESFCSLSPSPFYLGEFTDQ